MTAPSKRRRDPVAIAVNFALVLAACFALAPLLWMLLSLIHI